MKKILFRWINFEIVWLLKIFTITTQDSWKKELILKNIYIWKKKNNFINGFIDKKALN